MSLPWSTQHSRLPLPITNMAYRFGPSATRNHVPPGEGSRNQTAGGEATITKLITLSLLFAGLLAPVLQAQEDEQVATAVTQEASELHAQEVSANSMTTIRHPAIDAANEVFRLRLSSSHMPSALRTLEAVALIEKPGERQDLVVRFSADWVEWSESFDVSAAAPGLNDRARSVAEHIDLGQIETTVVRKEEAERKVKQCNAALSPVVRKLLPPFFNRPTNVEWDDHVQALILESMAPLEGGTNECVRADLNLRDGSLICRVVACAAR